MVRWCEISRFYISKLSLIFLIGDWVNNKANGKGKFFHADGDIYEGWFDTKTINQ